MYHLSLPAGVVPIKSKLIYFKPHSKYISPSLLGIHIVDKLISQVDQWNQVLKQQVLSVLMILRFLPLCSTNTREKGGGKEDESFWRWKFESSHEEDVTGYSQEEQGKMSASSNIDLYSKMKNYP